MCLLLLPSARQTGPEAEPGSRRQEGEQRIPQRQFSGFRTVGVPYFVVLIIRILLLFRVPYEGPLFSETPIQGLGGFPLFGKERPCCGSHSVEALCTGVFFTCAKPQEGCKPQLLAQLELRLAMKLNTGNKKPDCLFVNRFVCCCLQNLDKYFFYSLKFPRKIDFQHQNEIFQQYFSTFLI